MRVGEEDARAIVVTVDSGAAASVAPPGAFEEAQRLDPAEGVCFLSANGEVVPELYRVRPVVMKESSG